jgi:hypothetical protein
MGSVGNKENSTETADSNSKAKVDVKELQHALDVLAKYGIIPNRKLLEEKTGVKMKTTIIARVRGEDGKVKKIYEYENGKVKE